MMKFSEIPYSRPDVPARCGQLDALTAALVAAATPEAAVQIILEADTVAKAFHNDKSVADIRYTQNTADPFYLGELEYLAGAEPAFMERFIVFQRAMLASAHRAELEQLLPKVAFINAEIAQRAISPEILPDLEAEQKLALEYQQALGSVMVDFDGQRLPMPKMALYTQSADRAVRRAALEACGKALAEKSAIFDEVFDKMVALRSEIAGKLGLDSFIQLGYLRMNRNSYGHEAVENFRRQVKRELVPLAQSLQKNQAARLGLDALKFFDADVLRTGGNPRPVKTEALLYELGVQMYRDMKPETAEMIERMHAMETFDLYSRENKMAGGYCGFLTGANVPFIFANFSGTAGDVDVFTHEGGHAFEAFINRDQPLLSLTQPTLETCEVHSMGMEFMCWPYLDRFYGENAELAKVIHLIGALYFIPYGCLVDEFQHVIYAEPQMTPAQRHETWLRLEREYFPDMDYDGLPFYSEGRRWQRQLHIYMEPFYYIDYCLAQSCALQILAVLLEKGWDAAWEQYRAFAGNGGTLTFVQLLQQAGMKVPFEDGALKGIIATVKAYIEANEGTL